MHKVTSYDGQIEIWVRATAVKNKCQLKSEWERKRERKRERDTHNGREGGESGNGYNVELSFAKFK